MTTATEAPGIRSGRLHGQLADLDWAIRHAKRNGRHDRVRKLKLERERLVEQLKEERTAVERAKE